MAYAKLQKMTESLTPAGSIESYEVYNLGRTKDGCLGNTVASIVSRITGRDYSLPAIYYAWRGMMIKDMIRTYSKHIKTETAPTRDRLELALHRLDQRNFKMVLEAIKTTGIAMTSAIPIAAVLENSNISYQRGGIQEILAEINSKAEVAVTYKTPTDQNPESWWHTAHIGFDQNGVLVSFSDGAKPVTQTTIDAINDAASYLNGKARTWNFVSINNETIFPLKS